VRRRLLLPLLILAVSCSSGGSEGPSASVTTPPTTAAQTVEQQVEAAYLRSWDVYAKAVRTLDPSGLDSIYAGKALETVTGEIRRRQSERRPAAVKVEHDLSIEIVNETTAVVVDEYVNHSVRLDPANSAPVEADPNERITESYNLTLVEARWKVSGIVRQR